MELIGELIGRHEDIIRDNELCHAPMTFDDLKTILDLTIKKDDTNKILTFCGFVSAYAGDNQLNISFNSPSATGKSHGPLEISRLFPSSDVMEIAYVTPTAFFHDTGKLDQARGAYIVDLSRKTLVFVDQPHMELMSKLRPMLSHDKKELLLKITDKKQSSGMRTKTVILRGFPAVILCTAGLRVDEQEATRFLLLSPETDQEKIREAVIQRIQKEADTEAFERRLEEDEGRARLRQRILDIRAAQIADIKIPDPDAFKQRYLNLHEKLMSRDTRDVGKLMNIIKCHALLNLWHRKRDDNYLWADQNDIEAGFRIWEKVGPSQAHNVPPLAYEIYQETILPAFIEVGCERRGVSKAEIMSFHFKKRGSMLNGTTLREATEALTAAGLLVQEENPRDRRERLYKPTLK